MTTAAELASYASSFPSFRNLLINGDMRIAQRGTSFTLDNSVKYPVDRFFVQNVNGSAGEATISQSTTAPTDFKNSLKIDVTTADTALIATDQYKIEYRIEGQDIAHLNFGTSSAQTVTLSFYIRSNKTGNTSVALVNNGNDRAYVATFTIDSANTFERKEITIAGDQSGTWLDTNGIGLRLRWGSYGSTYQTSSVNQWVGSQVMSTDSSPINFFDSTDNELYITGVQLEVGTVATSFEHRPIGTELALCQRYFERINGTTTNIGTGMNYNDSDFSLSIKLGVEKRTDSIAVSTSADGSTLFTAYGTNFSGSTYPWQTNSPTINKTGNRHSVAYSHTITGSSAGGPGTAVMAYLRTNQYIDISAEL